MSVGNLEELIDENHAIVSSLAGMEYYVRILSFVYKDQLELDFAILMHNKILSVVGLLQDEVDPMIHTSRMTLADNVNLEEFVMTKDEFSGADIKTICIESGLLASRERRMKVTHADFKKAKEKVMFKKKEGVPKGLYM
ncbi:hypothetical protein C4D60_Mb04t12280 [Musa balbisiana]|uniref:AAA ATPase AAA+ lid domain-containing protein n=1 Tax=Musa balbisiana TaxID=52838 RepID=A0A4S8KBH2_MUSBA|nr:hypothetical protein C4D60_Mb04t12280 [Musa balbisiana]